MKITRKIKTSNIVDVADQLKIVPVLYQEPLTGDNRSESYNELEEHIRTVAKTGIPLKNIVESLCRLSKLS